MNTETNYIKTNSSLVNRCKNGENSAYKELYNLYSKAMFNISIRIVNNKDEAEDILQESFLKVFQNIHRFDGEAAIGGWLKRIVVNRSIDIIRKQKINLIPLGNAEHIEDEKLEENIIYDIDSIKNCIQELPDGYRVILTLYLFEEYSHKEIATLLNIHEGTSKSQYNRAKKKLIELIKQKNVVHER